MVLVNSCSFTVCPIYKTKKLKGTENYKILFHFYGDYKVTGQSRQNGDITDERLLKEAAFYKQGKRAFLH